MKAPRESQIPLLWLCRMCFPGCLQRSHSSCPADGNSPAQGTASAGFMANPSCRAQPQPSSDLAGPKHQFPELKIPLWGIYGAPRQPLQSTGSASPPAQLKLDISMPILPNPSIFMPHFPFPRVIIPTLHCPRGSAASGAEQRGRALTLGTADIPVEDVPSKMVELGGLFQP